MVLAIAIAVAIVGLVVFANKPSWAVWLTLVLLFFGDRPEIPALAFWGRYLPTVGAFALMAAVVVRLLMGGRFRLPPMSWTIGYALFLVFFAVSVVYNGSSWRDIVEGLGTNLRYPLFFVAAINANLSERTFVRALESLRYFALLQVPVALLQYLHGARGDGVVGTLGSGSRLAEVLLIGEIIIFARVFTNRKGVLPAIVEVLALMSVSFLGDIEILLLAAPLIAIYMFARWYGMRRFLRLAVRGSIVLVALVAALLYAASRSPEVTESLHGLRSAPQLLRDWRNPDIASYASVGRATILLVSWPTLAADPLRILWGFGPETTQGGTIAGDTEAAGIVCRELMRHNILCREPQSFRSLMEFGILGILFYSLPVVALWFRSLRHRPATRQQTFAQYAFEGSCVLFLGVGFWYSSSWRLDTYGFTLWFSAAAMWCLWRRHVTAVAAPPRTMSEHPPLAEAI